MSERYNVWHSHSDKNINLICREGGEALPTLIKHLGPWTGSKEGEVRHLRLPYRTMLAEQGFALVYAHVMNLQLEGSGLKTLQPTEECPQCKGTGKIDIHGGLRQKDCPRCAGRGWVRPKSPHQ